MRRLITTTATVLLAAALAPHAGAQDTGQDDYYVQTPADVFGDQRGSSGFRMTEEHDAYVSLIRAREALVGTTEVVDCTTLDPFRASSCLAFDAIGGLAFQVMLPR